MFLKNETYFYFILIIFFLLVSFKTYSTTNDKEVVLDYLTSLKYFSASFIQNDGEDLSEGRVYVGEKRIRAEYLLPSKILIILDEDKAMYYNYDLDEDEFFNPQKTNAWFFYDIFRNPIFFEDSSIRTKNNEMILEKIGINEDAKYIIKVYFEKSPLIIRAIEIFINDDFIKLSIYNHNYDQEFDREFFKLINPKFFN
tara:strand:- start:284 stop:877 length:594 start_codon:yes stop_codon:yes gene_type:complete